MTNLWSATVTQIGEEAAEIFETGVYILFGEPVPPALAEVSITHTGAETISRDLRAGDTFSIDDSEVTITAVGELATQNLKEIGHIVIYVNIDDQKLLPGAVHASGTLNAPKAGSVLRFSEGAENHG